MELGTGKYKKGEVIFMRIRTIVVIKDGDCFLDCYDVFSGETISINKMFHISLKEEILKKHC
jgi:hypothetical protein